MKIMHGCVMCPFKFAPKASNPPTTIRTEDALFSTTKGNPKISTKAETF